jgi:hypothetical protein
MAKNAGPLYNTGGASLAMSHLALATAASAQLATASAS